MAIVGCLGEIPFTVSSEVVQTFKNLRWSGGAKYSTHDRHMGNALTEFTGLKPDSVKFEMDLSALLGVNPMSAISMLWDYERKGTAVPLVIGTHAYGKYRWSVVSHEVKARNHDGDGDILTATVSVTLQEYLRE